MKPSTKRICSALLALCLLLVGCGMLAACQPTPDNPHTSDPVPSSDPSPSTDSAPSSDPDAPSDPLPTASEESAALVEDLLSKGYEGALFGQYDRDALLQDAAYKKLYVAPDGATALMDKAAELLQQLTGENYRTVFPQITMLYDLFSREPFLDRLTQSQFDNFYVTCTYYYPGVRARIAGDLEEYSAEYDLIQDLLARYSTERPGNPSRSAYSYGELCNDEAYKELAQNPTAAATMLHYYAYEGDEIGMQPYGSSHLFRWDDAAYRKLDLLKFLLSQDVFREHLTAFQYDHFLTEWLAFCSREDPLQFPHTEETAELLDALLQEYHGRYSDAASGGNAPDTIYKQLSDTDMRFRQLESREDSSAAMLARYLELFDRQPDPATEPDDAEILSMLGFLLDLDPYLVQLNPVQRFAFLRAAHGLSAEEAEAYFVRRFE